MDLRKEAAGRECQIRICQTCNPETVILAHLNSKAMLGGGMGLKVPDMFGAWGCSDCHDIVDGRQVSNLFTPLEIQAMFYEGVFRTQNILLKEGKIKF